MTSTSPRSPRRALVFDPGDRTGDVDDGMRAWMPRERGARVSCTRELGLSVPSVSLSSTPARPNKIILTCVEAPRVPACRFLATKHGQIVTADCACSCAMGICGCGESCRCVQKIPETLTWSLVHLRVCRTAANRCGGRRGKQEGAGGEGWGSRKWKQ